MRKLLSVFLLLTTATSFASTDLEMTFTKRSSQNIKSFLLSNSERIIKEAHKNQIEIYEYDLKRVECLELGGGLGSCVVSGDAFTPNSSSRWLINVTTPGAPACDYETTRVTFTLLDSEC